MLAFFRMIGRVILGVVSSRASLVAENLVLRQQLIVLKRRVKRPRLRRFDRWLIAAIAGRLRQAFGAILIVRPETVLRWHRAGWRLFWRRRSGRPSGRPPIDADLRRLIREMWRDNGMWGENMISGELAKVGYRVSPRTVAKYRPSGLSRGRGQRWSTFVRNHLDETWACDFFTIVTVKFRVLYVFVVLSLGRRRLVHLGVTEHPTAAWVSQRFVEATLEAEQIPRFLIHDRDSIFGAAFGRRVRGLGVRPLVTPPRFPQANAFCERVIGTIRRGCTDHVIVRNEQHAERVLSRYLAYYQGRSHRGLRMQPPDGAQHLAPPRPPRGTRIVATPILSGLHHSYGFSTATAAPIGPIHQVA